jgi:hypothetical protein
MSRSGSHVIRPMIYMPVKDVIHMQRKRNCGCGQPLPRHRPHQAPGIEGVLTSWQAYPPAGNHAFGAQERRPVQLWEKERATGAEEEE